MACFSALPLLTTLLLNHNRLSDVDDMAIPTPTTPLAAAVAVVVGTSADDSPAPASGAQVAEGGGKRDDSARAAGGEGQDDGVPSSAQPFPVLEAISLSGNRIGDWGAVDRLAGLPCLRSLRFSSNPVTSGLGASEVELFCLHSLLLSSFLLGTLLLLWIRMFGNVAP